MLNSISIPRSKGTDGKTIDCISSFYIGRTVSIILKWINGGFVETPEEIADVILRAIRSGKKPLTIDVFSKIAAKEPKIRRKKCKYYKLFGVKIAKFAKYTA